MNYLKEINAFYDRQEQTPLSSSAVALWYALMHMNNKTRWKNIFTTPASVLRNKAGLSESSFKRARKELVECGYIEVASQGRGKAPVYKMHSLVVEQENSHADADELAELFHNEGDSTEGTTQREKIFVSMSFSDHEGGEHNPAQHVAQDRDAFLDQVMNETLAGQTDSFMDFQMEAVEQRVDDGKEWAEDRTGQGVDQSPNQLATPLPDDHMNPHANPNPAPLNKQDRNKTNLKQNKTKASAAEAGSAGEKIKGKSEAPDAIRFYQENFGMATPFIAESLLDWIDVLGEELVIKAMQRALERGKTSWGYVKSILNSWHDKGIRTVDQAKAEQVAFDNERRQKRMGFPGGKGEVIPDWFYEQKQEREDDERKAHQQKATLDDLEKVKREFFEGSVE